MPVLTVGLNHRTADFTLLERVAVPVEEYPKALRSLQSLDHVNEVAVLSTCNRVELYANVTRFHAGLHELLSWLSSRGDLDPHVLDAVHYTFHDDRAAAHLFAVASGVDSMVVGEHQIALQVKEAAGIARDEGTSRRVLQTLFNRALHTSKRVRSETDISRGASSMVEVGLDVAARRWDGGLAGRTVLVVGAGAMGALTAERLRDAEAARVLVRNRTLDKAERLAAKVDGEVVLEGGLRDAVHASDLVVCCTGAAMPLIDAELVVDASRHRDPDRGLVLLDLAMPRNVDHACDDLDGVTVIDLDAIRSVADPTVTGEVLDAAREIVEDEAAAFLAWTRAVEVEPTIRALREHAEEIRRAELDRLGAKLGDLDEREREAVEALTRGIVNTLLHDPTVRLKSFADLGGAEQHALALRELFDLDE
ncbi:MAG: glutamyl-tRNA reductase [Actinobacteria bacterium]|nr:glutamyl-tRNA reductase [Actinomycetota bacterium]